MARVPTALTALDPLIGTAFKCLATLRATFDRHRVAGGAAPAVGQPDALADSVAEHLQAEALSQYAWLDVGVWGRPVYRSAAQVALRLQTVAVTGDELG